MPKFDNIGPCISQDDGTSDFYALLTGRTIAATEGAQTAINANIQVGHIVVADPNKVNIIPENRNFTTCVTQCESGTLDGPAWIVTDVNSQVNDTQPGGLANERRGGRIKVRRARGEVLALVPNGTAVGGWLVPAAGSYALAAAGATGVASIAAIKTHKCRALEANSSGGPALRRVLFEG